MFNDKYSDKNGAEGARTPDLCLAKAALSQLSYGPGVEKRRPNSRLEMGKFLFRRIGVRNQVWGYER